MAAASPSSRWHRVRTFTLGRGPLKRGSDRLEFAARLVLVLVVLVSVPVALAVGTVVHEHLRATAEQQAAELTRVTAVALEGAEPVQEGLSSGWFRTSARWTAPDGTGVEAVVTTLRDTSAGDRLTVWTTGDGRPTATPPTSREVLRYTVVLVWSAGPGPSWPPGRGTWACAGSWTGTGIGAGPGSGRRSSRPGVVGCPDAQSTPPYRACRRRAGAATRVIAA